MLKPFIKSLERVFKSILKQFLLRILPQAAKEVPRLEEIHKVLIFRLDQRVGNGILLLPLLKAIRASRPESEIHFLIHYPIAELYQRATAKLIDKIWPYNQPALMKRPWKYLSLLRNIRREKFDVVLTSHNPDNFSLSQAIFGRLFKPRWLVGFNWKDNARFYDFAVASSTEKHYAEAMVDLWRAFDPAALCRFGGLGISAEEKQTVTRKYPQFAEGGILIWLGATGNKILPGDIFAYLYEQLRKASAMPVFFAAGPADQELLRQYPDWIREQTTIWKAPLPESAAFFSLFSLFVSGDTGPAHLAAALNLPTLTIFVGSSIQQYGYHDGKKHFSLFWQGVTEDRQRVTHDINILVKIAASPAKAT
jgi:heptosyltransferase-2/heptosyltransferase-3